MALLSSPRSIFLLRRLLVVPPLPASLVIASPVIISIFPSSISRASKSNSKSSSSSSYSFMKSLTRLSSAARSVGRLASPEVVVGGWMLLSFGAGGYAWVVCCLLSCISSLMLKSSLARSPSSTPLSPVYSSIISARGWLDTPSFFSLASMNFDRNTSSEGWSQLLCCVS